MEPEHYENLTSTSTFEFRSLGMSDNSPVVPAQRVALGVESARTNEDFWNEFIPYAIVAFSVLIGDMARGIIFPTLWLRVASLGGDSFSQGIAVASFSFGRVLSAPMFGTLSETCGYRWTLIVCTLTITAGCFQYCYASSLVMLILGQFVTGFGAGNLGVTRSYVADCDKSKRTVYLAYLTAVQYAGFTVMPMVGSGLSLLGASKRTVLEGVQLPINEFTVPALFTATLSVLNLALLYFVFVDRVQHQHQQLEGDNKNGDEVNSSKGILEAEAGTIAGTEAGTIAGTETDVRVISSESVNDADAEAGTPYKHAIAEDTMREPLQAPRTNSYVNYITSYIVGTVEYLKNLSEAQMLIIGGCLLNIATKGTIGVYETLGAKFAFSHFAWDSLTTGYTVSTCGAVGVIILISFKRISNIFNDFELIAGGMILMMISCLLFAIIGPGNSWGTLSEFYIALVLMYALGYPAGHTAVLGMVSKATKNGPQGSIMGWFASAGSFARIVFPLVSGAISQSAGDRVVFSLLVVLLVVSVGVVIRFRKSIHAFTT